MQRLHHMLLRKNKYSAELMNDDGQWRREFFMTFGVGNCLAH